jgi:hypothetical protein
MHWFRNSDTVFGDQDSDGIFLYNFSRKANVPLWKIEKVCDSQAQQSKLETNRKGPDQHEKPSDADPQH